MKLLINKHQYPKGTKLTSGGMGLITLKEYRYHCTKDVVECHELGRGCDGEIIVDVEHGAYHCKHLWKKARKGESIN